ncbi:MAG: type IV secretion system protein [Gammaproteobacteria bacterium]|nr:type IV secretion system protein [Gammaproteobacteria bacterium]
MSYQKASDWTYDLYQSQTLWLRRSLAALILMALLLLISLLTNVMLFPLKEKVPYLYAFDHATGEITKIGKLDPSTLSSNWELSRYFLMHYVMNYESYDFDNIEIPYQQVWAQSSDNVRMQYDGEVQSNNAHSPYRVYGKDKYITVHVTAINKLNDNAVDIKFEKNLHDRTANTEQVIQKEAIVKWKFLDAETSQKMLDRDPLGFKVIYYQSTQVNIENH